MITSEFGYIERCWLLEGIHPMIRTSERVSQRMDYLSGLEPVLKSALLLESDKINEMVKEKKLFFHLVREEEDLLLKLELEEDICALFDPPRIIELVNVRILDFIGAKYICPYLTTKEEFFAGLAAFQKSEVEKVQEQVPRKLTFGKTDVKLSKEVIGGLMGLRGADHKINISLLGKCLAKKIKALLHNEQERFNFYFEVNGKEEVKYLNLIVQWYSDTNTYMVITAYYLGLQQLKARLAKQKMPIYAFLNQLPKVTDICS